jgi:hypothetical protein
VLTVNASVMLVLEANSASLYATPAQDVTTVKRRIQSVSRVPMVLHQRMEPVLPPALEP